MTPPTFAPRGSHDDVELGTTFSPKFDADGLIAAIVIDADAGDVLMVAHMNADALARTIASREAWFWSRSRGRLWRKGEESGNTLAVVDLRIDCDQDALLLKVRMGGARVACHQGYRSCFYRLVPLGAVPNPDIKLGFDVTMARVPSRPTPADD
jgi:phosphoribosyl-AMP cyclohydrolase